MLTIGNYPNYETEVYHTPPLFANGSSILVFHFLFLREGLEASN